MTPIDVAAPQARWMRARVLTRCFDGRWLWAGFATIRPDESLSMVRRRVAREEGRRTEDVKLEIIP